MGGVVPGAEDGPLSAPEYAAILTRDLTRRFGRVTALNNVSLQVPAGALLGLLGPNGSGKTTLLSILAGFIAPSSGSFQLLGQPDHRHALARTGSLISRPLLWPHLSCRDNLRCLQGVHGQETNPDRIDRLLAQVGLDGAAANRRFGQCSTGMKQRLGIAAALLGNPDLLLLDEPTTGLDPEGMVEVRELIRLVGREEGRTIVMSSHLLHEVELTCDRYAIIYRGQVIDQGKTGETAPPTTALRIATTDNTAASPLLRQLGWSVAAVPTASAEPEYLEVTSPRGEEWKIARDLASADIYPSAMQPVQTLEVAGGLEQKYLNAVGKLASSPGEEIDARHA